jgi:rhodanese-related sulfurtransferase
MKQLTQTKLFRPKEYDGTVEVSNRDAYDMCRRLNQEESIIAGPSSGMALAGALRTVPDEPGVVAVIIFPDNVFKYASSVARHFPKLAPAKQGDGWMERLMEAARNRHNTIEADELTRTQALLVDVRPPNVYRDGHVRGAVNFPLEEIIKRASELPADRGAPIVTICNRGNASLSGLVVLKSLGYRNVRSLNGGTLGWAERGLPTE